MRLQSVALQSPRQPEALQFLQQVWGLALREQHGGTAYLSGTGVDPYLIALTQAPSPAVGSITFSAGPAEWSALRQRMGGRPVQHVAALDEPGGGAALILQGPEGQAYRIRQAPENATGGAAPASADRPIQITHVVLNTRDLPACERFAVEVLGFQISDRTRLMSFVRCNRKHHCLAYAPAALPSLNHIAFEMRDVDAVMRGIGRLRDAGVPCAWGPGRHGPGNNVFAYFVAPYGGVIEYTCEISEVGEEHRPGAPEDWKWPTGRIDQWGVSSKDMERLRMAEAYFQFGA